MICIISNFGLKSIKTISICLGVYLSYKIYFRWRQGKFFSEAIRADGKVVIVTGANCGIGKETARGLAKRGAKVIMACRDLRRAEAARQEIIESTGNSEVIVRELNLTSFESIHKFCDSILRDEPNIDILINNAGVFGLPYTITEDGLELTLASNHYGHFLMTNLLLDRIKSTPNSRIVVVSSDLHTKGSIVKEHIINNLKDNYRSMRAYGLSKLCNILFANELARKLKDTSVIVNSLHPGAVYTEIGRNTKFFGLEKILWPLIAGLFFKTSEAGAQTTLYVALEPSIQTDNIRGEYFVDCAIEKLDQSARDEEMAKWLWDYSEKVTGLSIGE